MTHWTPSLLGVLQIYFTSDHVLAGILVALSAIIASFAFFALSKNHDRKSKSLLLALIISTSMWVFILSSVVLCAGLIGEYDYSFAEAVTSIARFALLPVILVGPVIFYLFRNRAMKRIYPFFSSKIDEGSQAVDTVRTRVSSLFSSLLYVANLSGVRLTIVPGSVEIPASAALDWKGEKVVAISARAALTLDDEELKAVLAHELGHIVHRDALRKSVATAYRSAFIFDPVAYFVEAAIYRNGELYADEYSARLTGRPAALASALIKIHESTKPSAFSFPASQATSMILDDYDSSIFSKQPSLTFRIKKLLEMENQAGFADDLEQPKDKALA